MRELYIIRGLPGSGKTTFASRLTGNVCEADQFFMQDGEYKYDVTKIGEAHEFCRKKVEALMKEQRMRIAVSNTFVRRWTMEPYYDLAVGYGYRIVEVTMSGALHKNIHGVPDEKIEQMRAGWEK